VARREGGRKKTAFSYARSEDRAGKAPSPICSKLSRGKRDPSLSAIPLGRKYNRGVAKDAKGEKKGSRPESSQGFDHHCMGGKRGGRQGGMVEKGKEGEGDGAEL